MKFGSESEVFAEHPLAGLTSVSSEFIARRLIRGPCKGRQRPTSAGVYQIPGIRR